MTNLIEPSKRDDLHLLNTINKIEKDTKKRLDNAKLMIGSNIFKTGLLSFTEEQVINLDVKGYLKGNKFYQECLKEAKKRKLKK